MTTPKLMVQISGKTVPLKNCVWVEYQPCGCPSGVLMAAGYGNTYATEDQARRSFCPTKRELDKAIKQGFTLELITFERYLAEIDLTAKCPHAKAVTR